MTSDRLVLDTNVFVAAGFNPNSTSARILEQVRMGNLQLVWDDRTRRETERILNRIPPLSWSDAAELFREEHRYAGETFPEKFDYIPDPEDRKFAALAEAAGAPLVTNDDHLLSSRERAGVAILTPGAYLKQRQG
jgi:uncharacterized protein